MDFINISCLLNKHIFIERTCFMGTEKLSGCFRQNILLGIHILGRLVSNLTLSRRKSLLKLRVRIKTHNIHGILLVMKQDKFNQWEGVFQVTWPLYWFCWDAWLPSLSAVAVKVLVSFSVPTLSITFKVV